MVDLLKLLGDLLPEFARAPCNLILVVIIPDRSYRCLFDLLGRGKVWEPLREVDRTIGVREGRHLPDGGLSEEVDLPGDQRSAGAGFQLGGCPPLGDENLILFSRT